MYIPGGREWSLQTNKFKDMNWIKNCNTESLTNLYLSYGEVEDVSALKNVKLDKLSSLYLTKNKLKSWPVDLQFPKLILLMIDNNLIESLTLSGKNYPILDSIYAGDNSIKKL